MSDIKILVAMHKKYWIPKDDVYVPLHVGAAGKKADWRCVGDDSGDNISKKNIYYCEMTGLYWAWKNLDCDYIGLCHYRRYFMKRILGMSLHIYGRKDYEKIMEKNDILLPNPSACIPSILSHYKKYHKEKDLLITGDIIKELYPEYYDDFLDVIHGQCMYFNNMFCMKKSIFDEYCSWIFSILFELEKRIDINDYDDYQKRVFGFIAERLMPVFVKHKKLKIKHSEILFLEKEGIKRKIQTWIQKKIY